LSLDIEACVYREFNANGASFMAPKWTVWQGLAAIELSREIVPRTTSSRSELDLFDRALAREVENRSDTAQALHLAAWSLAALVAALRPQDIKADYAVHEEGDIDVEATRESLRRNMDWLQPRADGPIRIVDRRFSTARVERRIYNTARLDLSIPLLACDVALKQLGDFSDTEGATHMLTTVRRRLTILCDAHKRPPSAASIRLWTECKPLTAHSLRLRNGLLRILALSRDMLGCREEVSLTWFVRHGFALYPFVETSLVRGSAHGARPRFYALASRESPLLNLSGEVSIHALSRYLAM
jgi:hypothetical protein